MLKKTNTPSKILSKKTKPLKKEMCQFCGKNKTMPFMISMDLIHAPILRLMKEKLRSDKGYVCRLDYQKMKGEYVEDLLEDDRGRLTELEKEVLQSLEEHEILSENINKEFDRELTFGERIADKVAEFGGSWKFIISFMVILLIWVVINSLVFLFTPFDPYPFILLNLFLSCLAALQAPIIMMSQNRQEDKDRLRSEYDYKINLKAELEIRHLNEKLDHLLNYQWQRLLEIQQLQLEIMEDLEKREREKIARKISSRKV